MSVTITLYRSELEGLTKLQCNALLVGKLAAHGIDTRLDHNGDPVVYSGRLIVNEYVGVDASITWSHD